MKNKNDKEKKINLFTRNIKFISIRDEAML